MTGLQLHLCLYVRTKPHSVYYLHGAARMHRELLKMHIAAAIASRPTEEVLAMLFEDDRPLLQLKMSNFTIEQEFEFIGDLSVDVYTYFALLVGSSAMKIRSDVLSVFCASVCVLAKLKEHPLYFFVDSTVELEQKLDEVSALESEA